MGLINILEVTLVVEGSGAFNAKILSVWYIKKSESV